MKAKMTKLAWLKAIHESCKEGAAYERYVQDAQTGWKVELPESPLKKWAYRFYVTHLAEIIWSEALRVIVCNHKGHDLEDTGSWGGPESGGEDMTCRRCGFHFHHTYY
jgi:hypothetical protein